ncbi:MAG: valine--tRNA ligase [Bacillota bacterium]|jgi:valyl-tRNA synthetase
MSKQHLPTVYDPKATEERWYRHWLDRKYFHAEVNSQKKPFTIVIPPPNITGALHLGHVMDNTMQDVLIRVKRMQGYETLWVPGSDHASIATEVKIEQALAKEGLSKHDLGRERFLERAWQWKEDYGGLIIEQLKKIGSSCDWDRLRFTLDEGCSRAVREAFVRLYEQGLIYRGSYIVNWCPRCQTVISDDEVEHEDLASHIWHLRYPLSDGSGYISVATTRPETMLGDTAVAVHPEDARYQHLAGKTAILPLLNREIPIVADDYVDQEFGTGAVKVTPAHDPNDFAIGLRHQLPQVVVIGKDGKMTAEAGPYAGMDRYDARKAVVADLEAGGYLVRIEDHQHAVGHCYRCHSVIEPQVSLQWFVRMQPLAKPAVEAVRQGRIRMVPERHTKVYYHWMENVHDWCISRQLWWGHRIPVWYCQECGAEVVSRQDPTACHQCGSSELVQDPDVLDTWFSSALWPFSTLGWPDKTPELEYFFPTNVLVTGYDILFFWVAKMIFSSLEFMDEVPFHDVLMHGLIRDAEGRKMSKSLGNGIDPLEVIEQYGADTLRWSLLYGTTLSGDSRYYLEKIEAARNFCNKIWNASRFVLLNLGDFSLQEMDIEHNLELADRWILSRVNQVAAEVLHNIDQYNLGEAMRSLYDFIWSEFCDWYIEIAKSRLYGEDAAAQRTVKSVLAHVLEKTMRLLHPFMPFITEEIWQHLPHQGQSIMIAPWPYSDQERIDQQAEQAMAMIMEAIKAVRNIRAELGVAPGRRVPCVAQAENATVQQLLTEAAPYFTKLAGLSELTIAAWGAAKPAKSMSAVVSGLELHLPLAGLIDLEQEIARLQKEVANLRAEVERGQKKLANPGFVNKAPADVVAKEREKLADWQQRLSRVEARLAELQA